MASLPEQPSPTDSSSPPSPPPPEPARRRGSIRRIALGQLFRAFPVRCGLIGGLTLLSGALPATFAVLVGVLVDALPGAVDGGFDSSGGRRLVSALVGIGIVLVAQEVVGAVKDLIATDLYRRFDAHLLGRVVDAATALPGLDLFEDPQLAAHRDRAARAARYSPGDLVSGMTAKTSQQSAGLASAALLTWYQPLAGVVLAALWITAGLLLQADYYRADPFWTDPLRRSAYFKRIGLLPQWAKELRIFGLADWVGERFGAEWSRVTAELWKARKVGRRRLLLVLSALLAAHAVVLALTVSSAVGGGTGTAELTVVVQALLGMSALAGLNGDVWVENGAVPVPDVMKLERMVDDRRAAAAAPAATALTSAPPAALPAGMPEREIRFENVGFAYPGRPDHPVFEGLDLTIRAGGSLAVVGLNGAGKTTLIKLLTGLSRPTSGRITVDGRDLAELPAELWRRHLAAVFQDFVQYGLPARENLGFGAVEALRDGSLDEQVLREAAELAGAGALLDELPDGLDTHLSRRYSGGVNLSGGQWQRIAIARAMLAVRHGARLLVLDEPTAALDVRAEADLYERFLEITRGRTAQPLTTVLISHRFSTVRRAERIVVLDSGRITEDGTHEQLLAADGRYAELFRTQAARFLEPSGSSTTEGSTGRV